jgi:hypothetical protein
MSGDGESSRSYFLVFLTCLTWESELENACEENNFAKTWACAEEEG